MQYEPQLHLFSDTWVKKGIETKIGQHNLDAKESDFYIPLDHIMIDELHLMPRITDRLEEGLIMDILKWDEVPIIISVLLPVSKLDT